MAELLRQDDPSALDVIYDLYAERLFGYISAIIGREHDAEDALQELFVRIARKRRQLAEAQNLEAYLFAMARHATQDRLRDRQANEVGLDDVLEMADETQGEKFNADEAAMVRRAVRQLPHEQNDVVTMKCFQDMTFEEISKALDISINTAASRYRYALQKLKKCLGEISKR